MTTYTIEGMHCGKCVARVTQALSALDPTALVSLTPPTAQLNISDVVKVQAAVAGAGNYQASLANVSTPSLSTTTVLKAPESSFSWTTYYPLLLIFGFLVALSSIEVWRTPNAGWHRWMNDFMAGFFIVFGFFKLLNPRAFARNFKTYDLAAKTIPGYAIAYPFIEVALGVAYLVGFTPIATNAIAALIMGVGAISVVTALNSGQIIDCACLGTVWKLPMSKVTLFEDVLMLVMALAMLATLL